MNKIPKVIHYCWFGKGIKSDLHQKCIESWGKYCSEYQVIEWNESNFDVDSCQFTREAYKERKFAFVSDYVRLYVLYNYGGIYLDTDAEVIRNIDSFLEYDSFSGYESKDYIPTAIMGSVKHNEWIKLLLDYYVGRSFYKLDGTLDTKTNVVIITGLTMYNYDIKLNDEMQIFGGNNALFPHDYFCPKDMQTGKINLTDNTYVIHHFAGSWVDKNQETISKGSIFHRLKENIYERYMSKLDKSELKNVIFFQSEEDFEGNARALFEYLVENHYCDKYKLVWQVRNSAIYNKRKYKNTIFLSESSFKERMNLYYYKAVAKYFFFTHPAWTSEYKEGQLVINLWHGTAIKACEITETYRSFHIGIVASEQVKKWHSQFFYCNQDKFIVYGAPRNDLLFKKGNVIEELISNYSGEKVLMCMPTFRKTVNWTDCQEVDKYSLTVVKSMNKLIELNHYLKENHTIILIKIHNLQDIQDLYLDSLSNIIYITGEDLKEKDIQAYELLGETDALLTDFSSVYYDYLLVNKPIGFLLADMDVYQRGFIEEDPKKFMAGDRICTYQDLLNFILNIVNGKDDYRMERKRINDLVNQYQDNMNCKRVAEYFIPFE